MSTWNQLIESRMRNNGESFKDVVSVEIDTDYYSKSGVSLDEEATGWTGNGFTVWTSNYIYFPWGHVENEMCDSVRRNPQ